jgi:hypothetical protein
MSLGDDDSITLLSSFLSESRLKSESDWGFEVGCGNILVTGIGGDLWDDS